jgi:hypothetical protein
MNAHAVSTQVVSGTFKHGAGRIILLALGGTIVAAAVVTAVAVRQSSGSDAPTAAANVALLGAAQAQHDALIDATAALFPVGSAFAVSRAASGPDEPGHHTTYLVGTEGQAAALAVAINDANTIRAASGESAVFDTVLLVRSDAEADAALGAIADGNRILAGLGEPEEYVEDLRGS